MTKYISIALSLLLCFSAIANSQTNNASFDLTKAFNRFYLTIDSRTDINDDYWSAQDDNKARLAVISELQLEIVRIQSELQNQSLTQSQILSLERELLIKEQEAIALDRERLAFFERRIAALRNKATQRSEAIVTLLESTVEELRLELGYDNIFDTSSEGSNPLPQGIEVEDTTDLLTEIVARINQDAPEPDPNAIDIAEVFSSDFDLDGYPYGVELAMGSSRAESADQDRGKLRLSLVDGQPQLQFNINPSQQHLIKLKLIFSADLKDFGTVLYESSSSGVDILLPEIKAIQLIHGRQPSNRAGFYRLQAELRDN